MNRAILFSVIFGAMTGFGCGSLKTGTFTNYDRVPLSNYQTYAWGKQTKSPSALEGETIDSALFDGWVREAVDRQMASMGVRLVSPSEADLVISYYFFLREDVKEVYNNAPYAQEWYQRGIYVPGGRVVAEMESTLYLNIVDVRKAESIWLGWGNRSVKPRQLSRAEIQHEVGEILEQLKTN